jgi:hypothetical protein
MFFAEHFLPYENHFKNKAPQAEKQPDADTWKKEARIRIVPFHDEERDKNGDLEIYAQILIENK